MDFIDVFKTTAQKVGQTLRTKIINHAASGVQIERKLPGSMLGAQISERAPPAITGSGSNVVTPPTGSSQQGQK